MAVLFEWEGTYDDTTSDSGHTIAGTGLSAGGGDGGSDTTEYNATGDRMQITGLGAVSNILEQSGSGVLNFVQGTILLRAHFDTNNVSRNISGFYTGGVNPYFYMQYNSANRIYLLIQDGSSNAVNMYLNFTPTVGQFYDIRLTWDLNQDNSLGASIDGGSFSYTSHGGTETNLVQSELDSTYFNIGTRDNFDNFDGEISRFIISDVFEDETLGAGTTYNMTMSESSTITDSDGSTVIFPSTISEAATITDAVVSSLIFLNSISDILSITDSENSAIEFFTSLQESMNISDTLTSIANLYLSISETDLIDDTVSSTGTFAQSITESVSITDLIQLLLDVLQDEIIIRVFKKEDLVYRLKKHIDIINKVKRGDGRWH
jgi:hypothetical protein